MKSKNLRPRRSNNRAAEKFPDTEWVPLSSDEDSKLTKSRSQSLKRARTALTKPNVARKQYVRGRRGGLQGIMKMPIEIFTEIASHLFPVDFVSLIRTNKFFRAMLLRPSTAVLWQRARSNVAELPPCPNGMSEPQYAALMFFKLCTLCGASAATQPDPRLRARLCGPCRNTKLTQVPHNAGPEYSYVVQSRTVKRPNTSLSTDEMPSSYCFHKDVDSVARIRNEFIQKGDLDGLEVWDREKANDLARHYQDTKVLADYVDSTIQSHRREQERLKTERRKEIRSRLVAIGWEQKYLNFDDGDIKGWKALVEVPKLLTERIWANLLPKLTVLLEENKARIINSERRDRQFQRLQEVHRLVCQSDLDKHPYQAIIDALGIKVPQAGIPGWEERVFLSVPFPQYLDFHEWDLVKEMYEEENSIEGVQEVFNECREQLSQRISEWRAEIESRLVKQHGAQLDGGGQASGPDPIVKIRGNTEATKHLPQHTRFLLRADTVFVYKPYAQLEGDWQYGSPLVHAKHFPNITSSFGEYVDAHRYLTVPHRINYDPESFVRHTGIETLVKALLKDIGMPDVAHIELIAMGRAFKCARCPDSEEPVFWENLVGHYQGMLNNFVGGEYKYNCYSTRHPVVFRNYHQLESTTNSKPLVRVVPAISGEQVEQHGNACCLLCAGTGTSIRGSAAAIREHMHDSHDTSEPIAGLHYTTGVESILNHQDHREEWEQKWDKYHDSISSGDPRSATTSQAGPSFTAKTIDF